MRQQSKERPGARSPPAAERRQRRSGGKRHSRRASNTTFQEREDRQQKEKKQNPGRGKTKTKWTSFGHLETTVCGGLSPRTTRSAISSRIRISAAAAACRAYLSRSTDSRNSEIAAFSLLVKAAFSRN